MKMSPFLHVKCRFYSTPAPRAHRLFPSFLLHPHRSLSSLSSYGSSLPPSLSLPPLSTRRSIALDDVHATPTNRHDRYSYEQTRKSSTFPFSFYLAAALGLGGAIATASSSSRDSSSCKKKNFPPVSLGSGLLYNNETSYTSTASNSRDFLGGMRFLLPARGEGGVASCAERLVELGPGESFEKGKLYEVTVNGGKSNKKKKKKEKMKKAERKGKVRGVL